MKKLVSLAAIAAALVLLPGANCKTPPQVVTNAVFTAVEVGCLIANAGLFGDSNAVKELEVACSLAPTLEPYIEQLISDFQARKAAAAKGAQPAHP